MKPRAIQEGRPLVPAPRAEAAPGRGMAAAKRVDISVIVASLTRGDWVASLESILNQDHPAYEVILVVDTADFDRAGVDYLQGKYDHLKVIFNHRNLGQPAARNAGAAAASGHILAIHDDDDFSLPHRLSRIADFMAAGEVDLACSYVYWKFPYSNRKVLRRSPLTDQGLKDALEQRNVIEHMTVAIRAEKFRELGGYNGYFRYSQDNELFLRAKRKGLRFACIPEPLVETFVGNNSITVSKRKVQMLYSLSATLLHNAEQDRTENVSGILLRFAVRFFLPASVRTLRRRALARFGRDV